MAVERRYFRYDVILPMHMEPVDRFGKHLGAERRQLITAEEEEKLRVLNIQIEDWLEKIFGASSSALYVFYALNHRLNFMWWLIDHLIESTDPRLANDFRFRCKEDKKFEPPKSRKESTIAPLILGFYKTIDSYLEELLGVVDKSLEGKIFIYSQPENEFFDDKVYVKNLDELAKEGVLPAKVLRLMIDKLNLLEMVLGRLKTAFRKISESEDWNHYQVNLSAGGFSFLSETQAELFMQMDIFMEIDNEVLICRGKVVSQTASGDDLRPFRVGIQFDLLTAEQEHKITLFEQRHELRDAMMTVAVP